MLNLLVCLTSSYTALRNVLVMGALESKSKLKPLSMSLISASQALRNRQIHLRGQWMTNVDCTLKTIWRAQEPSRNGCQLFKRGIYALLGNTVGTLALKVRLSWWLSVICLVYEKLLLWIFSLLSACQVPEPHLNSLATRPSPKYKACKSYGDFFVYFSKVSKVMEALTWLPTPDGCLVVSRISLKTFLSIREWTKAGLVFGFQTLSGIEHLVLRNTKADCTSICRMLSDCLMVSWLIYNSL